MDVYFNGYKIRYEILNKFLLPIRASNKVRNIDIYINIDDLFHKLHRPYTEKEFQYIGSNASIKLLSNLINIIGHYRNWAIKESMQPKVYLYYTTSKSFKNSMRLDTYRKHYLDISSTDNLAYFTINNTISDALTLLQTIVKYIPNTYAVDSSYIEPSLIPLIISKENNSDLNLIISRDEFDLQYTCENKFAVLSPKGDNSNMLVRGNLWQYIRMKEGVSEDFIFEADIFTSLKSLVGDKYRGIPRLSRTGWKRIISYIRDSLSQGNNQIDNINIQEHKISLYLSKKKIDIDDINRNLYVTSIQHQYNALFDIDKNMVITQLKDMQDIDTLRGINNTLFKLYPINLPFLLKQTSSSTPNDKYYWR